jgi:hypothetical protein
VTVTLGFLLEDYMRHLRHHLKQIQERRDGPTEAVIHGE